jgi:hypothetical protein
MEQMEQLQRKALMSLGDVTSNCTAPQWQCPLCFTGNDIIYPKADNYLGARQNSLS